MLSHYASVGDKVEIRLKKNTNTKKTFFTQIEEVVDEKTFILQSPISYGKIVVLPAEEIYNLVFSGKSGLVSCDTKVISQYKKADFYFIKMAVVSNFDKVQRREYFRHACLLPLKYCEVEANVIDKAASATNSQFKEGIIKDLSGGGIKFVGNEHLEHDQTVQFVIQIAKNPIVALGKIISRVAITNSSYKNEYRAKFISISKVDQEKIIQYVFEAERKVIKRG